MKIMYKIICANGFQGIKYYKDYEEAKQAATFRANVTGKKWEVKIVILK